MNKEKTPPSIEIITTGDGSHSLFLPHLNETYHSKHGAIQESTHVFIDRGLAAIEKKEDPIHILEVGFGTGLNAWLTWKFATLHHIDVRYTALEPFPLKEEIYGALNFSSVEIEGPENFKQLHDVLWETEVRLSEDFSILKKRVAIQDLETSQNFDLVYYDAFGPPTQPEMWDKAIFRKIFGRMNPGGIFVTYCAKGQVRRDLQEVGFFVERLDGPPGKRQMIRASKK